MKSSAVFTLASIVFLSNSSFALTCKLTVTRIACLGREAEAYSKCKGQKTCDEIVQVESIQQCEQEALDACQNAKLEITKQKTITVTFEGTTVDSGKNFCKSDRGDFNRCPEDRTQKTK